jgi:copper resistance protein B
MNAMTLVIAAAALLLAGQGHAQEVDHSAMDHSKMDHSQMDHAAMGHDAPPEPTPAAQDHSTMDHAAMGHDTSSEPTPAAHDHAAMGHAMVAEPKTPLPAITEADRAAAFPALTSGQEHHSQWFSKVLVDELETWEADDGRALRWGAQAWVGSDLNRVWLRSGGERVGGVTEAADVELLFGRGISPWWDVVAGVRHDFRPGDGRDYLAVGVIGMAPYKFEVDATAYLGESGQSALRLEAEYEALLGPRWVLQPKLEAAFYGKDEPARGIGQGLNTLEAGLRLRYEVRRRFAPYVGVAWERAYGQAARLRRMDGADVSDLHMVAGVRLWF